MVALLWDAGQVTLALELEELWNDLGSRLPFALLCAYPARLLADDANPAGLEAVCHLHATIIGPPPDQPAEKELPGAGAEAVRGFPGVLGAARAARHFVTGVLRPRHDQALTQDAAIVTAERAANAVLHAGSAFTVAVSQSATGVRISVRDAAPMQSVDGIGSRVTSPEHGLGVVSAITSRWAVEPLPGGKVVWAELPAAPQRAR